MLINVRKLAALDIVFHGTKLIITEFAAGVCLPLGLGILSILRGRALWQSVFGVYMLFLAFNYLPLLIHAVLVAKKGSARKEVEMELANGSDTALKYTRQSALLLLPFVIPCWLSSSSQKGGQRPAKLAPVLGPFRCWISRASFTGMHFLITLLQNGPVAGRIAIRGEDE